MPGRVKKYSRLYLSGASVIDFHLSRACLYGYAYFLLGLTQKAEKQ
jgi:hypothetical protein